MEMNEWPEDKVKQTMVYLNFLSKRSKGEINTGARFLRNYVTSHSDYKLDSNLTQ